MVKEKSAPSKKEPTGLESSVQAETATDRLQQAYDLAVAGGDKTDASYTQAVENHLQSAMKAASEELAIEPEAKDPRQAANTMRASVVDALQTAKGNMEQLSAQMEVQATSYRGYFDEANKAMGEQQRIIRMCEAALLADKMS